MKRKEITEYLQNLFEEKKKEMYEESKKKKEDKKPYVEDSDSDDDEKKMRQDKGAYSKLSSTGVSDSTVAEEVIEEAIDPKIQKHIKDMQKKGKNEIEILMEIDKKYPKLSKKELEAIASHLSD